jgi:hypothetical protein
MPKTAAALEPQLRMQKEFLATCHVRLALDAQVRSSEIPFCDYMAFDIAQMDL